MGYRFDTYGEFSYSLRARLAKLERADIAKRSRRGQLQKAREGKVLAGRRPNYGFKLNATRDGYEVYEENTRVVRRIFEMVGVEKPDAARGQASARA